MKLLSINVSEPEDHEFDGKTVRTSIYKKPVGDPVHLDQRRLAGDGQANLKFHGQPFQAVYAYPFENYAYWQNELKRNDFSFGQFGENFTTEGLSETMVHIGDVYKIGGATVQVTFLRAPCGVLGLKMGSQSFIAQFRKSLRTGFYMRVLDPGDVKAGDTIERMETKPENITVADLANAYFNPGENRAVLEDALAISGLAEGAKNMINNKLKAHHS